MVRAGKRGGPGIPVVYGWMPSFHYSKPTPLTRLPRIRCPGQAMSPPGSQPPDLGGAHCARATCAHTKPAQTGPRLQRERAAMILRTVELNQRLKAVADQLWQAAASAQPMGMLLT